MLVLSDRDYCIEDLNSSNGTLLRGTRLTAQETLKDGDRFIIMGHILEYTSTDEEIEPPQGKPVDGASLPTQQEGHDSTQKMDPSELNRRLNKLLEDEGFSFDDE